MSSRRSPHLIRGSVPLPESELVWRFTRSSGPGGQHVNTSDSRAELRFDLAHTEALPAEWRERALERLGPRLVADGVLVVRSGEHRSQWRNREAAAARMAALLAEATAPPPPPRRRKKRPRAVEERRLHDKRRRGEVKRGRSGRSWD
jgi:ribosome-associated protein